MNRIFLVTILLLASSGFSQLDTTFIPIDGDTIKNKYNPDHYAFFDLFSYKKKLKWLNEYGGYKPQKQKKVYAIVIPGASYNPFTNLLFALSGNISMFLGNPKNTRMSSIVVTGIYTLNKQYGIRSMNQIYLPGEKIFIEGKLRWLVNPNNTYGVGGRTPITNQTVVIPSYLQLDERVMFKVNGNNFVGVGWTMDWRYNMVDHSANGIEDLIAENQANGLSADQNKEAVMEQYQMAQFQGDVGYETVYETQEADVVQNTYFPTPFGTYDYGTDGDYFLTGFSGNYLHDTRDNVNATYKGSYILASFYYYPAWRRSTPEFAMFKIDARQFIPLSKNNQHILALWGIFELGIGDVIYYSLPSLGENAISSTSRGYVAGRYRGPSYCALEAEYRVSVWKWLGFAGFVNLHSVAEESGQMPYWNPGGGVGLRIKFNKKTRVNVAVDYGIGIEGSSGIYFRLSEAF